MKLKLKPQLVLKKQLKMHAVFYGQRKIPLGPPDLELPATLSASAGHIIWHRFSKIFSVLPQTVLLSRFSRVRLCATHRRQPTRLPRPWDSPGKNTGVGCHFKL